LYNNEIPVLKKPVFAAILCHNRTEEREKTGSAAILSRERKSLKRQGSGAKKRKQRRDPEMAVSQINTGKIRRPELLPRSPFDTLKSMKSNHKIWKTTEKAEQVLFGVKVFLGSLATSAYATENPVLAFWLLAAGGAADLVIRFLFNEKDEDDNESSIN
jgi:hypothetical protein